MGSAASKTSRSVRKGTQVSVTLQTQASGPRRQQPRLLSFKARGSPLNSGANTPRTLSSSGLSMGNSHSRKSTPAQGHSSSDTRTSAVTCLTMEEEKLLRHIQQALKLTKHVKCTAGIYPREKTTGRADVPADKVSWDVGFEEYSPVNFTAKKVITEPRPVWADPDILDEEVMKDNVAPTWNEIQGKISRKSHMGEYKVLDGLPRNPIGRTGMTGRGCLGRWGPNHAADPIVTRWKRDERGEKVMGEDGRPILQFVAVKRADNGQWAIPGGMVDPGDTVTATVKKEFGEEAMNSLEASEEAKKEIETTINQIFNSPVEIYRGYVDDPRNTDNCWMETVVFTFHDSTGEGVGKMKLHAGDDAVGVQWADIQPSMELYASHSSFVKGVALLHAASGGTAIQA